MVESTTITRAPSVVILAGAGASASLGLPLMNGFVSDDFWNRGNQWFMTVAYMCWQWSRANRGFADFEYIYTLAHLLSTVSLEDPLASVMTQQAPAILEVPGRGPVHLNVDAVRKGAVEVREYLRAHVHDTLGHFDALRGSRIYADLLNPLLEKARATPPLDPVSISIFTTNYDRVIESIWQQGHHGKAFTVPTVLRRGFVHRDPYQPGLSWDPRDFDSAGHSGEAVIKLFKLHGSLHWRRTASDIVETEANEYVDTSVVIYPLRGTKLMLEEPFATLFRFWRTALSTSTDCVVVGSSLRDPHLVTGIEEALNQNPRFKVWLVDKNAEAAIGAVPEAIRARVVPITAEFGQRNLGALLADYIFDPAKREGVQGFSRSDEVIE